MSLDVGPRLGSLEITVLPSKGGMAEVYRARDLKLKRDVAIKILPEEFSRDAERVRRFQREAKVLSSLNHPDNRCDLRSGRGEPQTFSRTRTARLHLLDARTRGGRLTRAALVRLEIEPVSITRRLFS
jgi:serine/threonine protein kinase